MNCLSRDTLFVGTDVVFDMKTNANREKVLLLQQHLRRFDRRFINKVVVE